MIHLEVTNRPIAQKGIILTHRDIECLAFEYVQEKRKLAIYETFEQWVNKTPGYWFIEVETITYFDDDFLEVL